MGKCPKCSWTGSNSAFMKHYASKHYKKKKQAKKKASKRKFKVPVWARKGRR